MKRSCLRLCYSLAAVLFCQPSSGQVQPPTVRSIPQSLDGSNQFGLILEGFRPYFFWCISTAIEGELEIEFDGEQLLIRRLFTPCGGYIGDVGAGLPTFIPISAVLPDQDILPVPLPVRIEVVCPPELTECPSGPGLPPGLIGEFLVGKIAGQETEPLQFEPGLWQEDFNPWRFFNFEKQAGQFIAAAGYAAGSGISSDLRWSVGAAPARRYMELTFHEPGRAVCFNCGDPQSLISRPIQPVATVWLAFDAPNLAFLSDGAGNTARRLTRAPLATGAPPFGPLTGRFDVLDREFPASWLDFDLGNHPQYGVVYNVDTDLDEMAEFVCFGAVDGLSMPSRYTWSCELTLRNARRKFDSGLIAIDSIYMSKQLSSEATSPVYEVFARRRE